MPRKIHIGAEHLCAHRIFHFDVLARYSLRIRTAVHFRSVGVLSLALAVCAYIVLKNSFGTTPTESMVLCASVQTNGLLWLYMCSVLYGDYIVRHCIGDDAGSGMSLPFGSYRIVAIATLAHLFAFFFVSLLAIYKGCPQQLKAKNKIKH